MPRKPRSVVVRLRIENSCIGKFNISVSLGLFIFFLALSNLVAEDSVQEKSESKLLSLSECEELALTNHLPTRIAKEEVMLATLKVTEAKRNLFPAVTLTYEKTKGEVNDRSFRGERYNVEAKQPVFHSGELKYKLEQAEVELEITEANCNKVTQEISFEVARAYYNLAKSQKVFHLYQGLVEEISRDLDLTRKQLEAGVISKLEFFNIESQYNEALYGLTSAESEFNLARLALEQKLNLKEPFEFNISAQLEAKELKIDLDKCLALAFENRPEFKMNKLALKFSDLGKRIARANGLPKIDISGRIGKGREAYKDEDLELDEEWFVGAEFSLPLGANTTSSTFAKRKDAQSLSSFYGGPKYQAQEFKLGLLDNLKVYSEKEQAEVEYWKAENQLNEIKQKINSETEESFYGYKKAKVQLDTAKSKFEFRKREVEVLKAKKEAGKVELSQVLEARLKQAEEEAGYIEAFANLNIAIASLNKAIGRKGYF